MDDPGAQMCLKHTDHKNTCHKEYYSIYICGSSQLYEKVHNIANIGVYSVVLKYLISVESYTSYVYSYVQWQMKTEKLEGWA